MPLSSNGSSFSSGLPVQPIHAPWWPCITGASAVTSPPGLRRHAVLPSGISIRSTGSRLATTTKELRPFGICLSSPEVFVVTGVGDPDLAACLVEQFEDLDRSVMGQ